MSTFGFFICTIKTTIEIMKRIFFVMLIGSLLFGLENAQAQAVDGAFRVGGHMGYGTSIESFGIGARGDYAVSPSILIAPDFMYFFGKNDFVDVNWFDINFNGNYLIEINNPDLVPLRPCRTQHSGYLTGL